MSLNKPKDPWTAEWLVAAPRPHLTAQAAHALLAFDIRPDWNEIKVDRMRAVVLAKFVQHPPLAELLLATKDAVLIEDSKTDGFWGIGKNGKGKNMLGTILMETREKVRRNRDCCLSCGEIYIASDDDYAEFDGPHDGCPEEGRHRHFRDLPCPKCREKAKEGSP